MDLEVEIRKRNADQLAREVARLIDLRIINSRSAASDALLRYLRVGDSDGPDNVPEWCEKYDRQKGGEGWTLRKNQIPVMAIACSEKIRPKS